MTKTAMVMAAIAIAAVISRLVGMNHTAVSVGTDHHIPDRIDPADFALASGRWLAVVFSSTSCETCRRIAIDVANMDCTDLFTTVVQLEQDPDLHTRYRIDAVPTTVIADPTGTVRKSFLGPVGLETLQSAFRDASDAYESGNV